ncbi:hypothetical protein F2Q69_00009208 [Brassica cretica]|uniref:Uncharacterized protein n=1 Tax=Brassica cretica TaxID=69181 RepID=A0A8S9NZI9_BRACR|nr:hypothetical protein F2Q69_00009208 [Brassica cretica]
MHRLASATEFMAMEVDSEKQPIKREISPESDSSPPCPKISIHDYYLSSVSSTSSTRIV